MGSSAARHGGHHAQLLGEQVDDEIDFTQRDTTEQQRCAAQALFLEPHFSSSANR
jgi:hypothetical protein